MKMLIPLISTIMTIFSPGFAHATEGQVKCVGCMPIPATTTEQSVQKAASATLHAQAGIVTAKMLDYWGIGKVCSKFADPNGFGPYAKVMFDTMTPDTHPSLYEGSEDVTKLCKSFPKFDVQQKEDFYVYVTAHLAFAESSCDPTESAKGPNGTAQGLLALHKNMESDYTKKDFFRNKCKNGDSRTAERSLRCGLAMLDGQFAAKSALFPRTGYWGPYTPQTLKKVTVQFRDPKNPGLRLKARKMNANTFIKMAIQMYPYCK